MTVNIIDVDAFTSPVVAPLGDDDHHLLSTYLLNALQALANRTFRANQHMAVKDSDTNFTATQSWSTTSADAGAILIAKRPDEDPHVGNKFRSVVTARLTSGPSSYANVYSGSTTAEARLVLSVNAGWDTAAAQWVRQDTSRPAVALLVDAGGIRAAVSTVNTWATWPETNSNVRGADFRYTPVTVRASSIVQFASAIGGIRNSGSGDISSSGGAIVPWALRFPPDFGGGDVQVAYSLSSAAPLTLRLVSRAVNFSSPGSTTRTVLQTFTSGTTPGNFVATLSAPSSIDADTDYQVEFVQGAGADAVQGIRVANWFDAAPRNTF